MRLEQQAQVPLELLDLLEQPDPLGLLEQLAQQASGRPAQRARLGQWVQLDRKELLAQPGQLVVLDQLDRKARLDCKGRRAFKEQPEKLVRQALELRAQQA